MELILYHLGGWIDLLLLLLVLHRIFGVREKWTGHGMPVVLAPMAGFALCNGIVIQIAGAGLISGATQFYCYSLFLLLFSWLYAVRVLNGLQKQILITILFYVSTLILFGTLKRAVYVIAGANTLLQVTLLSYPLLGLYLAVYCGISRPVTMQISNLYWAAAGATPLLIILLMNLLNPQVEQQRWLFVAIPALLILLLLASYFLFMRLAGELESQMELEQMNQMLTFQIRQMDSVSALLEETRQMRHELKNHCFLCSSLLAQKRYDELEQRIQEMMGGGWAGGEMVSTGNKLVDSILSLKISEARVRGIPIVLNVLLPEQIALDERLLCSLLFNLLDNAIEASAQVSEPDIRFSMREMKGYLSIEVRNRINGSVLQDNPQLRTSKDDSRNHGVGMTVIRQIVRRCDGDLKIWEENGDFIVSILLPERNQ